jgi:methyl-accepting chemotaxis protein
MTKSASNDFNPNELTQKTDEHTRNIAQLQESVSSLEERIGDNDKFANTFSKTFDTSKKLDTVIVKAVVSLIETHDEVKTAIGKAVKKSDRDWVLLKAKSVWGVLWSIVLLLIGVLLERYILHK